MKVTVSLLGLVGDDEMSCSGFRDHKGTTSDLCRGRSNYE